MKPIVIRAGDVTVEGFLNDTPTARAILEALPISGQASTWGDEIYFPIPVKSEREPGASAQVSVGDLAFWPEGNCFCIFFGPTPMSRDAIPVAANPVNVVGRVEGDLAQLRSVKPGSSVNIDKA